MDPSSWGPYYWGMLHKAALANVLDFPELVQLFPALLPCPKCSNDFRKIIEDYPLTGNYFIWSVDVHNQVNKKLGKSQVSYEDAHRQWTTSKPKIQWIILAAVIFIIVIVGLLR